MVVTAAFARLFHLADSYDIFVDEISYLRLSEGVAEHQHIRLFGEPFYLHPPGFFLLEGGFLKLFPETGPLLESVQHARVLNAVLGALCAGLVFLLVKRVAGSIAGVAAGIIFALDPFIIQFNSRNLIETPVYFWILIGYIVIVTARGEDWPMLSRGRATAVGVVFGIAVLTKDMAAIVTIGPLLLLAFTQRGAPRIRFFMAAGIATMVYLTYLLAVILAGEWEYFREEKLSGLERILGLKQETGFNQSGGPSFLSALLENVNEIGATYLLIGIGLVAVIILWRHGGGRDRVLAAWLTCSFVLLGYAFLFGTLEEQFFYMLVVPAVVSIPCAVAVLLRRRRAAGRSWAVRISIGLALVIVFGWSGFAWFQVHTVPDRGFEEVRHFLRSGLPPGARVAITTDPAQFLLEGYVADGYVTTASELRRRRLDYIFISSYQATRGYGAAKPQLYEWVVANSRMVFGYTGRSFGLMGVYQLPKEPGMARDRGRRAQTARRKRNADQARTKLRPLIGRLV